MRNFQSAASRRLFKYSPRGASFEFRRGNFGEAYLLIGDPRGAFVNPRKATNASGIVRKLLDRIAGSARVKCGHHQKDTADEAEFHEIRGEFFRAIHRE